MKQKTLSIVKEIFENYPFTTIGYLAVINLSTISEWTIPPSVKSLAKRRIIENSISIQNVSDFPAIKSWRNVYQSCGVKPKTYKSSIESLVRRFIQDEYREIIPVVDLYNYVSAQFLVPIGGYDLEMINGNMKLTVAEGSEGFCGLSGKENIKVEKGQIIYSDEDAISSVVCWMWNQKDAKRTMLTPESSKALFIFDCLNDEERINVGLAMEELSTLCTQAGAIEICRGVIDTNHQSAVINY